MFIFEIFKNLPQVYDVLAKITLRQLREEVSDMS